MWLVYNGLGYKVNIIGCEVLLTLGFLNVLGGEKLYKKKLITADLLKHNQLVLCVCANVVSPHLKKKQKS